MEELDKVIEMIKRNAEKMVEGCDEVVPIVLAISDNDIGMIDISGLDKMLFKPAIAAVLNMIGASAYIHIGEAWRALLKDGSPKDLALLSGKVRVRDLPLDDKEEVIVITAVENSKSYRSWSAKIFYDRDRRFIGQWREDLRDEAYGRMVLKKW